MNQEKNKHRCRLFRGRTRRFFTADVSVFAGTPPEKPSRDEVEAAVPNNIEVSAN